MPAATKQDIVRRTHPLAKGQVMQIMRTQSDDNNTLEVPDTMGKKFVLTAGCKEDSPTFSVSQTDLSYCDDIECFERSWNTGFLASARAP